MVLFYFGGVPLQFLLYGSESTAKNYPLCIKARIRIFSFEVFREAVGAAGPLRELGYYLKICMQHYKYLPSRRDFGRGTSRAPISLLRKTDMKLFCTKRYIQRFTIGQALMHKKKYYLENSRIRRPL